MGLDRLGDAPVRACAVEDEQDRVGIVVELRSLPELLGVCDTIAVMCRGVLSEVKPVNDWTEHSIIAAAIGATEP